MGTSNWQNISYCIGLIRSINPQKILDMGVGFGRWGILCREFLEVWNGKTFPENWNVHIDGVEIFPKNISEYHRQFYSNIFIEDAYDFIVSSNDYYDLIILGDVLEHFEKEIAKDFLRECITRSRFTMLNIPIGNYWKQDVKYGNESERHLSFWKLREFIDFKPVKVETFRDNIYRKFAVILFSENEKEIAIGLSFKNKISELIKMYPFLHKAIKKLLTI